MPLLKIPSGISATMKLAVMMFILLIASVASAAPICTVQLGSPINYLCPADLKFSLVAGNYVKINVAGTGITNGVTTDAASLVVGVGINNLGLSTVVRNLGLISVNFDGAAAQGHAFTVSTTNNGQLHDEGTTTCDATSLGIVSQTVGAAGMAQVWWNGCPGGAGGGGGGVADPGANGPMKRTSLNVTAPALAADIVGLFGSCSGVKLLAAGGNCVFPAPGVMNLLEGDGAGNIIDSGVSINNVVGAVSPGVGLAHFPGGTQTATSSLLVAADIASGAKQGGGTKIQMGGGATTTNDCVKYDSSGTVVDAGAPCGAGSGSFLGNASDPRLQMTVAGAVATMSATMSSTNPANILGGSTVFSKTTVSTLTIASNTGSTGSVAVCGHSDGSFTYNHNISGTVITGAGDFPSTAVSASGVSCSSGVPLHILTITSVPGNFDAYVGSMDKRPVMSIPAAPTTGDGTTIACPSGICSTTNQVPTQGAAVEQVLTDAATVTVANASTFIATYSLLFTVHSGSRTVNFTGLVDSGQYVVYLKQDATGGEGVTLGSGCSWKISGGGAGAITPSATANAVDMLTFTYRASNTSCYGTFGKNFN